MKKLMAVLFGVLLGMSVFAADTELTYDQEGTRMFGYACGG